MLRKLVIAALFALVLIDGHSSAGEDGELSTPRDTYVGTIEMSADKTIIIRINYFTGEAFVDGVVRYVPSEPGYDAVLSEVGGLQPGEVKRIRNVPGHK